MAGRPRGCHCWPSSWEFNPSGYVRCAKCGGAPGKYAKNKALEEAHAKRTAAVGKVNPNKAEAAPATEVKDAHAKLATTMTAVRDKKADEKAAEEAAEAKRKSRKVGVAKVKTTFPARVGGSVKGQSGQGYIFADEPDKVYVVGIGWFGSWDIGDVEFKDPADTKTPDAVKPDILITEIASWNDQPNEFLVQCRQAKRFQGVNGFDITVGFVNDGIDYLGTINGVITGVWKSSSDGSEKVFSITPPMWGII